MKVVVIKKEIKPKKINANLSKRKKKCNLFVHSIQGGCKDIYMVLKYSVLNE